MVIFEKPTRPLEIEYLIRERKTQGPTAQIVVPLLALVGKRLLVSTYYPETGQIYGYA